MSDIVTFALQPGTAELSLCARWRVEAFSGVIGAGLAEEVASLERFATDQRHQVALVAKRDGIAAGTCLLVPSEIQPMHDVSPWLAGLYVAHDHRRRGVGEVLVRAIEKEARDRGHRQLYLYTSGAAAYYQRLGWAIQDRVAWKGSATILMVRELGDAP